ncbi:hypothetical protein PG984_004952 [Apiospora sp. TS-2023a]
MEEQAFEGEPADVYLVRFMLSKSASSYDYRLVGRFISWLQRLDINSPIVWMSHHALKIHGDYYELCRDSPSQLPFLGTAKFRMVSADGVRELEDRRKWTKDDMFLGTTTLTPRGIKQRLQQHEEDITTDYLHFTKSPLKPRPYSLINSNCQHFVLDLALYLRVEFDEHGLAEVWRGTTIVRRVLAPTMGLLGAIFSVSAFVAESKWAKLTSYIVSCLYFVLYQVILTQDRFMSFERQTLLHALHFDDIDHKSNYLCQQFRKLHYRIRSFPQNFYSEAELARSSDH